MTRNRSAGLEIPCGRVARGVVRVPGSKSLTQRALILSALARGRSTLDGALDSEDSRHLRVALRRLGVGVRLAGSSWSVRGTGGAWRSVRAPLRVGNAGTAMRFLTALVGLGNGRYVLDGTPRMRRRPIGDLIEALNQLGVAARCLGRRGCPPVEVRGSGSIPGGEARLCGTISSQYLSALLMVAPLAERPVTLRVPGRLVSAPYVDLTLGIMRAFGARVGATRRRRSASPVAQPGHARRGCGDAPGTERIFRTPAAQHYSPRRYRIEGDASSATYFLAAAAITGGRVRVANLPAGSLQADARFLELLRRMGCRVHRGRLGLEARGPADGALRGLDVDMEQMPDAVPTLAAVALFARTASRIRGAAHLRVKESDRLRALAREIARLGGTCRETSDGLIIQPRPLRPALVRTYEDHRMAMSFALVGLRVPGVRILDPGCVRKSFPGYFRALFSLLKKRC